MKRLFYIFFICFAFYACSSSDGVEGVYTLTVDKDQIEADGVDMAVFTVVDAEGNVVSTSENLGKIYFKNMGTGFNLPRRSIGFTSISNGEYEFSATVFGVPTENTVKIKAVNRQAYEYYHRNVGLFKCTSVWCSACPTLSATLHNMDAESAAHSVVLSCHGAYEYKDPLACTIGSTDLGNTLKSAFNGAGWPTLIYDLASAESDAGISLSELSEKIMARRVENPATCGIKVNSSAFADGVLSVNASMATSKEGSYDLTCALVADALTYDNSGAFSENNAGVYNDVVIAIQSNFITYSSQTGRQMQAGEEFVREFTFELGNDFTVSEGLSVVVFAHRKTSRGSVMDNIISVPFGQASEYVINE